MDALVPAQPAPLDGRESILNASEAAANEVLAALAPEVTADVMMTRIEVLSGWQVRYGRPQVQGYQVEFEGVGVQVMQVSIKVSPEMLARLIGHPPEAILLPSSGLVRLTMRRL